MNSVSIFVKSLVTLTFMWCIAENILPEKSIKKYSSYIYGLIIISMTISVFTSVDFDDFRIVDFNMQSVKTNDYLKTMYEEKLGRALSEKFDDTSVRVELTDEYKIKNIYCDNKKTYDAIMRYLNENN